MCLLNCAYQPAERTLRITRSSVEVGGRFKHPSSIKTKSNLIVRDADILGSMAKRGIVRASISITTLDRSLARAMEPRAATPTRRLAALESLAGAGVPTSVNFAPVIPGLNDHELEAVLEQAAAVGATGGFGYVVLRLPLEIKDLFREWLEAERPDRARRVMSLVRQMRGGKDYDARWNQRMKGEGPIADLIWATTICQGEGALWLCRGPNTAGHRPVPMSPAARRSTRPVRRLKADASRRNSPLLFAGRCDGHHAGFGTRNTERTQSSRRPSGQSRAEG